MESKYYQNYTVYHLDDSFDIDAIYTTSFAADIGMFDHYRKVWDRENGYH